MKAIHNQVLDSYTTMACPSVAEYFYSANSSDALKESVLWARENNHNIQVLGGGSNVILPEKIEGLVIKPDIFGIDIIEENDEFAIVEAGAGENWHKLVTLCVDKGLSGIENLALIPGTCGAAPMQNIGAYGVEVHQVFDSLDALNVSTLDLECFDEKACEFAYRDSVFKSRKRNQYVILKIRLKLNKQFNPNIEYPALKEALQKIGDTAPKLIDVMNAVIKIRQEKLPDPNTLPNSGSFFKNPIVDHETFNALHKMHPSLPHYNSQTGVKLPAAWLIEHVGWKGKEYLSVKVHENHALVLTNPARKTAADVVATAHQIRQAVKASFGLSLEMEPQIFV